MPVQLLVPRRYDSLVQAHRERHREHKIKGYFDPTFDPEPALRGAGVRPASGKKMAFGTRCPANHRWTLQPAAAVADSRPDGKRRNRRPRTASFRGGSTIVSSGDEDGERKEHWSARASRETPSRRRRQHSVDHGVRQLPFHMLP